MSGYFSKKNELYFAKIVPSAIIPHKRDEDAGYDIYAIINEPVKILPRETRLISTGIACAVSSDYYLQVEERSSIGSKGLKKSAGVIDSGYRGEIKIALTNTTNHPFVLVRSEADYQRSDAMDDTEVIVTTKKTIAQLVVHVVPHMFVQELSYNELKNIPSARNLGGFGSTD